MNQQPKVFQAEEWNKNPQKVYQELVTTGKVIIEHGHYRDKIFELSCRDRAPKILDDTEFKRRD